jgi:hypothetical protein
VAAELGREAGVRAEAVRGGLGEFSVLVDGRKVLETNRLLYPLPGRVVKKVKALLAEHPSEQA